MTIWDALLSFAGLTGSIVVAGLAWRSPSWGVALVVASVPLQAFARIGTSQSGVTWTQAWLWTFLATGALLFAAGAWSIRIDGVSIAFAIVVACYIVSEKSGFDQGGWRREVYRWAVTLAFFVVARGLLHKRSSIAPLVIATIVGAIWTGVLAIVQVAAHIGPASFRRTGQSRAYASFGEPNTYGAFAAGCLVVLVVWLVWRRVSLSRSHLGAVVGAILAGVGLAVSQSRGAVAATGLTLAPILLLRVFATPRLAGWSRTALAVSLAVFALIVMPRIAGKLSATEGRLEVTSVSWANEERLAHWVAAERMIVTSHGFGIGAGQFDSRYRELTPTWRFRISQGHAHNAYLQVAAEAGIAGVVAYLAMLCAVLIGLVRQLGREQSKVAAGAALAATVVFALHNLVDYLHVLNLPIILVAWWAMALGPREGKSALS